MPQGARKQLSVLGPSAFAVPLLIAARLLIAVPFLVACPRKHDPSPRPQSSALPRPEAPTEKQDLSRIPPPPPQTPTCLRDIPDVDGADITWGNGADASGRHGVVTSVDVSATRAGIEILEAGGNAVDAAVGAAFALAVTHPSAGNIGGGGFLTLKIKEAVETIDFRENSPSDLSDESFWKMIRGGGRGPASVGVPGTVAGLYLAHQRHGRLPWKDVIRPSVTLAESGYPLGERQAKTIVWAQQDLRRDEVARAVFFPAGAPAAPGTTIKRPLLATALRRIMENGPDGFYSGPTAADLVESLGEGGLLTLKDLRTYKAVVREPICFDFQGLRIIAPPAPSAGGVALTQALLMLQASHVEKSPAGSVQRFHLFAEASRRAQAERQLFVVAPDSLSDKERQAQDERARSAQNWLKQHPISQERATPSSDIHPSYAKSLAELEHTTHLSVIDEEGGLVSLTVTLSGSFGARIFTKKTGIVLNNSAASFSSVGVNTPQGGQRTTSSMAPTLALYGRKAALVLGSPGGDTIPSTVSQLLLHLAIDKKSLKEAVEAGRVHQTFAPGTLTTEKGRPLAANVAQALQKMGHQIVERNSAIGDANTAVRILDTSYAVCDSREGGAALAASR